MIYVSLSLFSGVLKPLTERVTEIVLRKRVAVCDGYSKLFKSLCDHAGIRSEIINGYAKPNMEKAGSKFKTNHTWNAVYVDSNWHLLDVTWASGFVTNSSNEFIKSLNEYYFFTPPQYFVRDHYPEDLQWILLTDTPMLGEFYQSPFRYTAFIKQKVISFLPEKGIIEASVGDSIHFEVETENAGTDLVITDSPQIDSSVNSVGPSSVKNGKKMVCNYSLAPGISQWLYVVCNGEIILRYKLNLKKDESISKK